MSIAAQHVPTKRRLPRSYTLWLAGASGSQLGDTVMYFALGWAATAHGGKTAGLVLTAINLPRALLLLLGGATGDRFEARRIMIIGDASMLAVTAVLCLLALRIGTPVWLLLAVGLIVGTVDAFYLPAAGSMPRRLLADNLVSRALTLRQTISQAISLVGAPLGGTLVALAGLAAAAGLDAVTFALVLAVLVVVRPRSDLSPARPAVALWRVAADGIRLVAADRVLRRALPMVGAAAGFLLPVAALLVPLLVRKHGWNASVAGLIVGAQSVGIIGMSLLILRRGAFARPGPTASAALLIAALGTLLIATSSVRYLAIAAGLLSGIGLGLFMAHLAPLLLVVTPSTHLSRVQSLLILVQSTFLLFTNNLLGFVSDLAGPAIAAVLCAVVLVLVAAWAMTSPDFRNCRLPTAEDRADDPSADSTDAPAK